MSQRFLQYAILTLYLSVSFAGLLYTLFRVQIPILWPLQLYAYQMMAPYQGYSTTTQDIQLEGLLPNGEFQDIPVEDYFPYARGERTVRIQLPSFQLQSNLRQQAMYEQFAQKILEHTQRTGKNYTAILLRIIEWPLSSEGYTALRMPEHSRVVSSYFAPNEQIPSP